MFQSCRLHDQRVRAVRASSEDIHVVQSEQSRKQVSFSVILRPGVNHLESGIWFLRVLRAARLVNMVDILQFIRAFAVYDY